MKFLTFIVLLMIVLAQFLKAEDSVEKYYGVKILKNFGDHNYILCIEEYKWLKFNGYSPQQMFEIHRYNTSVEVVSLPVSCN